MEGQKAPSVTHNYKAMGPHVKVFLEQWYERIGRPKKVPQSKKDEVLQKIQADNIEPAGISVGQLRAWLARRRLMDKEALPPLGRNPTKKGSSVSQGKLNSLHILFPTLTSSELAFLQILVNETPHPSFELISTWSESPSLPNVTPQVAQRFVKYNQAGSHNERGSISTSPSTSKRYISSDDVKTGYSDVSEEEEEDMLQDDHDFPDHTHLPTPTSTSPEPKIPFLKPDPGVAPASYNRLSTLLSPHPILPPHLSRGSQVKEVLRNSRPLTTETQDLVEDNSNSLTNFASTSAVSQWSGTGDRTARHRASSSHGQAETSSSTATPHPESFNNTLKGLAEVFHENRTGSSMTPDRFVDLMQPCQERSDKFLAALQRGELMKFGLTPRDKLETHMRMGRSSYELDEIRSPEPP